MSKKGILATVALGAAALAYCFIENRQLALDEYTIESDKIPESFDGKCILHLSDLHRKRYGDGFNNLLNSCSYCSPDYIFFTGDLFSRCEDNLKPKVVLMQRLLKIAPVYYVMGNHETDAHDKADALIYVLEREGVHVLRNSNERIYCNNDYINIYGAELPIKYYEDVNGGYCNIATVTKEALDGFLGEPNRNECNVLLSHLPFAFEQYKEWGADIVFSGHCHGGVIRLPIVGGVLSPERKFFPKYTKGIYENGETSMVVSAGLGKFRLNNPSQIVCVTLKSKKSGS